METIDDTTEVDPGFAYPRSARAFVALRMGQYALVLAIGVVTARALGPEGRAAYIVPLTIAGICWVVLHLTLNEAGGRLIGRGLLTRQEVARVLVTATLAFSVLGVGSYALTYLAGGRDLFGGADPATIWLACASIPPMMGVHYASDLLVRLDALVESGIGVLLGGGAQTIGVLAFWATGALTPAIAVALSVVSLLVSMTYLAVRLGRRLGWRSLAPSTSWSAIQATLAIGGPLHSGSLSLQLGPRVDLLLVGVLFSAEDTGLYSLSLVLADAVFLGCRMLAELALPAQTLEVEGVAIEGTKRVTRLSARIGLALGLLGAVLAPLLVPLVFGDEWKGSVVPLVGLIAAAGAIGVINPVRTLLVRLYVPWRLGILALATLLANVALTVLLAGPLGLGGAALASTAVFWAYAMSLLYILRRLEFSRARTQRGARGAGAPSS